LDGEGQQFCGKNWIVVHPFSGVMMIQFLFRLSSETNQNNRITMGYEFVTFDGELLFHNDRGFHAKSLFEGFESELEVYQYIIDHRRDSCKKVYKSIKYAFEWSLCHRIYKIKYFQGGRKMRRKDTGKDPDEESDDDDYEYETDEEYDRESLQLSKWMSDPEFMLKFSHTSWQYETRFIHAFTLLDTSEKLYNFMTRYGHIEDDDDYEVIRGKY
jgi:hypothetical protein